MTEPLDGFAKKKVKLMEKDKDDLRSVNRRIIQTLDMCQQKINSTNSTNSMDSMDSTNSTNARSDSGEYVNILSQALMKVPDGKEDECLTFVLNKLFEFDEEVHQNQTEMNNAYDPDVSQFKY